MFTEVNGNRLPFGDDLIAAQVCLNVHLVNGFFIGKHFHDSAQITVAHRVNRAHHLSFNEAAHGGDGAA